MNRLDKYIKQVRGVSYNPKDISDVPLEDYLPILKANNIQENALDTSNLIYIHKSKIKQEQLIKKGDLLIAASSGSKEIVGKNVFFEKDFNGSFGAFCKVVRPNQNIHAKFLSAFFKTPIYRRHIRNLIQGANINNLRNEDIDSLKIPEFSIEYQIHLANILSKAEAFIAQRNESIRLLDELLKSTFLEMFGDPVKNEKGWEKVRFKEIARIDRIQVLPEDFTKNDFYIGLEDIEKETGNIIKTSTGNAEELKSSKFRFTSKHILYAKLRPYLNKVALPKEDGICSTDIFPILPISNVSHKYFVCYLMRSSYFVNEMTKKSVGANLPRANPAAIENLQVYKPIYSLQTQFAEIVEKVELLKTQYKSSLTELENLYGSLSQKAFKGELDIGKLNNMDEDEYSSTDNDRTEPKPFDLAKEIVVKKSLVITDTLHDYYWLPVKTPKQFIWIEPKSIDWFSFLKKYFVGKSIIVEEVSKLFDRINYNSNYRFNYREFKEFVFKELKKENSFLQQEFNETNKQIELTIKNEIVKA